VTTEDLSPLALVGLAVAIAVAGLLAGLWVARLTGWAPAAGLALLVATPLVPHVPVVAGLSLDDILPLLGIAFLATAVDLRRLASVRVPWLLVVGLAIVVVAGIVSSLVNASSPTQALTMLLRSPGRYAFLATIVVLVALAEPADRRRTLVARSVALLGTAEATFGLAAFFLPLGGLGLEPTRKFSVLYVEVPGRIAGTLGISPNFLGAIFVLTIIVTAGLAIEAGSRRDRLLLWTSVLVQALALTLTFTRASLGLAIVGLAVLLLLRGRIRYLVPVLIVVALGFVTTPSRAAPPGGSGDDGSGAPVAIERLTSDIPDRLALWYSATLMMIDHPLAGVGPGRTLEVAQGNPDRYIDTPVGPAVNNAHNTVLLAGAEVGLAGAIGAFLVNLAIALAALRILLRGRRPDVAVIETAGAVAILGYLAQGMVNNLFNVAAAGVVFAVVAGAYVIRLEVAPSARLVVGGETQRQRAPTGPPTEPSLYAGDPLSIVR
jgi:O-antigen ligase